MDWSDKYGKPPYKGKFFTIDFGTPRDNITVNGKEAIIKTRNFENAMKVSDLINAAIILLSGDSVLDSGILYPVPFAKDERNKIPEEMSLSGVFSLPFVQQAAKITCKASFRKAYYYALFKYRLGCSLCSISTIDLDPSIYWYEPLSSFPSVHTRCAYAIILFYSVIEELGLEIRASTSNPSFIEGEWNSKVKEDLETRLRKNRINVTESFSWNLRSTPTKIERELRKAGKLKPENKSSWAKKDVRDSDINLVDAILLLSNLRSRVSSHKFGKLVGSISIYDVSNANFLARRLLLESMGFWHLF